MSRSVINMLWVDDALPWYALASIKSFIHHGHEVHLYSYGKPDNLPEHCKLQPAAEILPESNIFTYQDGQFKGYLSGFSNWFRYQLLTIKGGWWADSDTICLRPFEGVQDNYVFASGWEPKDAKCVNNNIIYVTNKNSNIMRFCADECKARKDKVKHAETGPLLLSEAVKSHELTKFIANPETFNPIAYGDVDLFLRPSSYVKLVAISRHIRGLRPVFPIEKSASVHMFTSVFFKKTKVRELEQLPEGSYLRRILATNGSI